MNLHSLQMRLVRWLKLLLWIGLHLYAKTPVGAGNIFLRHRQACQKLRKTSPAPTGLLRVITAIDSVYIVD